MIPNAAIAAGYQDWGTIFNVSMDAASGTAFLYSTGARGLAQDTKPTCATANRWAISAATPAGQAVLSAIMTAFGAGKSVVVFGTGNCNTWADTETIQWISER
jgi:hypothetical protein